ncbi:MAG: pitrilysin family protein [Thermodesulfobacteriota bacterium]
MAGPIAQAEDLGRHLYKSTLDNGLTVIVKETPASPAVTVQIWVRAGSVYEDPGEAGITHLIEHMIFKGTPTRGPGELAGVIEGLGGSVNAFTSYEYTVYHATLAAAGWEAALDVLADAVLHSVFDPAELEREKQVVLEEVRMRQDRPPIRLFEALMANAYSQHPYRRPIIGSEATVASLTRDKILAYIDRHYQAGNLAVVVVGDVAAQKVEARVSQLLGGLPASTRQRPELVREPLPASPRFFQIVDDVRQVHLAVGLPISRFDSPDTAILDLVSHILGHGESSRLYHRLRDELGLVFRIDASTFTPADPGLLEITALVDPAKAEAALEACLTEVFRLRYQPVTAEELERAKRNLEADFVFNLERVEGQARMLGSFEFLAGDPRETAYLNRLREATAQDVQRVAGQYFEGSRVVAGLLVAADSHSALEAGTLRDLVERADAAAREGASSSLVPEAFLSDVHRFQLDNGITLLVREAPDVPTVGVRLVFPGGLMAEDRDTNGAFTFLSELLPKGTEKRSAREMSLAVADMAADIAGFTGKNTFGLRGSFLARFLEEGLGLMAEVIRTPALAQEEIDKLRPELLAQLRQQDDSLPTVAFRELNRQLYGDHPYGLNLAGSETSLAALTREDLARIYRQQARPERLVMAVVGDVQAAKVRDLVARLFGDWPAAGSAAERPAPVPPDPPPAPRLAIVSREKEQVHLVVGFLGTTLSSPDRFAIDLLETVLSGQSGRLFAELRDKESLAYSLSAFTQLGLDTGGLGVYIGTSPDKKDDAIRGIWRELYRLREEPISAAELARAKSVLAGHYQLGLESYGAQALEMALNETYDLGLDFGRRYLQRIADLTAADVQAVARKYIQPDRYIMVTVGAGAQP